MSVFQYNTKSLVKEKILNFFVFIRVKGKNDRVRNYYKVKSKNEKE